MKRIIAARDLTRSPAGARPSSVPKQVLPQLALLILYSSLLLTTPAAATKGDPEEPDNTLQCACSDVDPRQGDLL